MCKANMESLDVQNQNGEFRCALPLPDHQEKLGKAGNLKKMEKTKKKHDTLGISREQLGNNQEKLGKTKKQLGQNQEKLMKN